MRINKLDLHGTTLYEAESKVINFIEDNWDSNNDVEIITGNSYRMKNVVSKILDLYKLSFREGRLYDMNKGYIVVNFN